MKKFLLFVTFVSFFASLGAENVAITEKIEVYYFHYSRRCITCKAVEAEAEKAVKSLYSSQLKSGKIIFKSINLDDKTSLKLAKRCKVEGQSLLIIKGNERIDLTEQAFMNARNNPERLKLEIKKCVDNFLK